MFRCDSLLVVGLLLRVGTVAQADVINVPGDQPTIQAGIDAAGDGDEVVVADGVYSGSGNKNLDFAGKAITVRSENGPDSCIIDCEDDGRGFYFHTGETDTSIIDGLTIQNGLTSTNSPGGNHGGGIYCVVSGPTIQNCVITDNRNSDGAGPLEPGGNGGGIYIVSTPAPTLMGCTISGNHAGNGGAGGADQGGPGGLGGGIYCFVSSALTITDCTVSDNMAGDGGDSTGENDGGAGGHGGGIYCADSKHLSLSNCSLTGNVAGFGGDTNLAAGGAGGSGGGIYAPSTPITMKNCTVSGNQAGAGAFSWISPGGVPGGSGGGVYTTGSFLVAEDCAIQGNHAGDGGSTTRSVLFGCAGKGGAGGGIWCDCESSSFERCVVTDNSSGDGGDSDDEGHAGDGGPGGGLWAQGSVSMVNCDVSVNTSGDGGSDDYGGLGGSGGGVSITGTASIVKCDISSNRTGHGGGGDQPGEGGSGGGVFVAGTVSIVSSEVSANVSGEGGCGLGFARGGIGGGLAAGNSLLLNSAFRFNQAGWDWKHWTPEFGVSVANALIVNCVFAGNGDAGGVYAPNSTLIGCTVTGNVGDGISCIPHSAGISNSIVWGNTAAEVAGTVTIAYSDIGGGWSGEGNIDADPLFVDVDMGDVRLLPGSPCIDAADNTAVPPDTDDLDDDKDTAERIPIDLDGNPRFADDPDTADTGMAELPDYPFVVDMGAHEFFVKTPTVRVVDAQSLLIHDEGGPNELELPIDLDDSNGIEPRNGGPKFLAFVMDAPVDAASINNQNVQVFCANQIPSNYTVAPSGPNGVTIELDDYLVGPDCCVISFEGILSTDGAPVVDTYDVISLEGDLNFSGGVTGGDSALVKPHFGEVVGVDLLEPQWDFDRSGGVTGGDFALIKTRFGDVAPACP